MTSTIMMDIHEIQVKTVSVPVSNSDNVYMSATIPDGYKFLCWIGFVSGGFVTYAYTSYDLNVPNNIRVWLGMTGTGTVKGSYLVYR